MAVIILKLCIPSSGSGGLKDSVGEHFGRVPNYTLVDSKTEQVDILENKSQHKGGAGLPANILAREGVDVLICANLGRKAIDLCNQHGIEVHIGADGTVQEAIRKWHEGKLEEATTNNACEQGKFGKHNRN